MNIVNLLELLDNDSEVLRAELFAMQSVQRDRLTQRELAVYASREREVVKQLNQVRVLRRTTTMRTALVTRVSGGVC